MKKEVHFKIHPIARGISLGFLLIGTMIAEFHFLIIGIIITGSIACCIKKIRPIFLSFFIYIILPLFLSLVLIWGIIIGGTPENYDLASPVAGIFYASTISLRLLLVGAIVELTFLTLNPSEIACTLRIWGLRGDAFIIAIGAIAIMPEIQLRLRQIIDARLARGTLRKRNKLLFVKQIPSVLPPLIAWCMRAAIQRAELWEDRKLTDRFFVFHSLSFIIKWNFVSIFLPIVSLMWTGIAILY